MNNTLLVDTLSGIIGGMAAVCVGQPLDTVKVKMQLFPNMYQGMFSCMKNTARQQGIRGFYAGIVPALVSTCADNAVTFGMYGQCQEIIMRWTGGGRDTTKLNCLENATAGCLVSLFTSVVICPLELTKIHMQGSSDVTEAEVKKQHPSLSQVVSKIWKNNGFRGMYRGIRLTMAREAVGCPIFFASYEWVRDFLKPINKRKEDCDSLATMIAGATAGLLMWLVVYPIDVIKCHVQMSEEPIGYRMMIKNIRMTGMRKLYSGLRPTLIKTIPVTSMLLFCVEFSKPIIRKHVSENKDLSSVPSDLFSLCDFVSGWTAGVLSTCIGYPTDTIRVIQQVTNINAKDAMIQIYKTDKFAGYFKGMMFPISTMGVISSVYFGVSGNVMRIIQTYRGDGSKDLIGIRYCCDADNLNKYWHFDVFISGCVGGFCSSFVNIPNEVVKIMLQATNITNLKADHMQDVTKISESLKITTPLKLIISLYKINGIRSLYRGGSLLMIRDVPGLGIYMVTYEHACCLLKKLWLNESVTKTKKEEMLKYVQLLSGGIAGVLSWGVVLPVDVIKSKIMTDSLSEPLYKGACDCVRKTYKTGAVLGFYKGFGVLVFQSFPVNGVMFLMYEMVYNVCKKDETQKQIMKSKWL